VLPEEWGSEGQALFSIPRICNYSTPHFPSPHFASNLFFVALSFLMELILKINSWFIFGSVWASQLA